MDSPIDPTEEVLEYRGLRLDRFQAEAIAHVKADRSVLVAAPTGTGKTIIADYVVEQALKEGRDVIYTAPIKALSNQKYRDYTRLYGREKVGLVTGDLVINQDAQIRIMTTEILRNILLQRTPLGQLSHVIVDEVHFLDDEERGTVWEELLIYLPPSVKIVALSATLPNIEEFAEWLSSVRGERVEVVKENRRAVPLKLLLANVDVGILDTRQFDQDFKRWLARQKQESQDRERDRNSRSPKARLERIMRPTARERREQPRTRHLDMVDLARPDYLPVLYFVFSRRQTEAFARELARVLRRSMLTLEDQDRVERALDEFSAQNKDVLTDDHRKMYLKGVAFHHAGLHVSLKALVEELYERKLVAVLYCTSTFALGINMPARSVIFDALRKYNGQAVVPLTVRQFLQKAGRAGRRGKDRVGYVLIRQDFSEYAQERPQVQLYLRGEHEKIESAFNLSFSSVVNLLNRYSEQEIRDILNKSFLNFHQRKALERERQNLTRLREQIGLLEQGQLPDGVDRYQAGTLKKLRKQARRMEYALENADEALFAAFQEKSDFLKLSGYLDDDGSFGAGAKALMHIQIDEIFVTELLLEGVFETLDEDELFGVLTALVQDLPRSVSFREPLKGRWVRLREVIKRVRDSEVVVTGSELMGSPVTFCPELMPIGHLWAEGHSLAAIMLTVYSDVDVTGDLVGAFRRAKDLAGQLRQACKEDDALAGRLSRIITKVSRDEVEVID